MAKRQSLRMITGSDIRARHPTNNSHQTDYYYTRLANRLADCFRKLDVDFGDNTASVIQYSSVILTNYMEDIVADCGLWRTFSSLCQQHLGYAPCIADPDNPFYDPEYAKEEVNEMLHDTSVSTALMQYLLRNNFLPDLNGSTLFCHTATASEKNSDTQFYLRYLRQEKY